MKEENRVNISGHVIGLSYPVYIIAELSANHNQNFDQAVELIHAAKQAGADAVKLQTYTPDTLTINCNSEHFRIGEGSIWEGKNLYELYKEAYTPWEWQPKLMAIAKEVGLDCFSTPFDYTALEFLEKMNPPAYKIASFELVDLPLIRRVAETGKPIIMSTGMATLAEIDEAVQAARNAGATQIALLKCSSAYPAPPEDMNLRTIPHMSATFNTPVGLSDHTLGISVPVAAVTLGACIIEKHLTLSRSFPGPDSAFSLEPDEFKSMANAVRTAEKALGTVCYEVTAREEASRKLRRSLFAVQDIKAGEQLTTENIRSIRPGNGLSPKYADHILGRTAKLDILRGCPLDWEMIG